MTAPTTVTRAAISVDIVQRMVRVSVTAMAAEVQPSMILLQPLVKIARLAAHPAQRPLPALVVMLGPV